MNYKLFFPLILMLNLGVLFIFSSTFNFGDEDPGCFVQVVNGLEVPLDNENLKPNYPDGIMYHQDDRQDDPEKDPVFVISGDHVLKLQQNQEGGWDGELVGLAFLKQYSNLNYVGQVSSYHNYQYYPSQGQIRLADGTIVVDYMNEYDPPYWTWAWNSLLYTKGDVVRVFIIHENGSFDQQYYSFSELAAAQQ